MQDSHSLSVCYRIGRNGTSRTPVSRVYQLAMLVMIVTLLGWPLTSPPPTLSKLVRFVVIRTRIDPVSIDDSKTMAPCPLLLLYSTNGVLIPYTIINEEVTDEQLADLVKPPQPLSSTIPPVVPSSVPSSVPSNMPSNVPSSVPSTIPSSVPSTVPSSVSAPQPLPKVLTSANSLGFIPSSHVRIPPQVVPSVAPPLTTPYRGPPQVVPAAPPQVTPPRGPQVTSSPLVQPKLPVASSPMTTGPARVNAPPVPQFNLKAPQQPATPSQQPAMTPPTFTPTQPTLQRPPVVTPLTSQAPPTMSIRPTATPIRPMSATPGTQGTGTPLMSTPIPANAKTHPSTPPDAEVLHHDKFYFV